MPGTGGSNPLIPALEEIVAEVTVPTWIMTEEHGMTLTVTETGSTNRTHDFSGSQQGHKP